jgi:hypothetical protein
MTMGISMLELLKMEKNMAKANTHPPMDLYTRVNLKMTSTMAKASIYYQVE